MIMKVKCGLFARNINNKRVNDKIKLMILFRKILNLIDHLLDFTLNLH